METRNPLVVWVVVGAALLALIVILLLWDDDLSTEDQLRHMCESSGGEFIIATNGWTCVKEGRQ